MKSFAGRDILSLKEFERNEFFHVFEVADIMEKIARGRKNVDMLKEKTMVTAFYQPSTAYPAGTRGCHAPTGWARDRFFGCQNDPRRRFLSGID